jgi:hypothetical protein
VRGRVVLTLAGGREAYRRPGVLKG